MSLRLRFKHYVSLMRWDKPVGILLLLWPTLWALWLASNGNPDPKILAIFIAGVILMRSAGCIINDMADRNFDSYVTRTRNRPLASKKIKSVEALVLLFVLVLCAFLLVLFCNAYTIQLAFIAIPLTIIYPFLKRITHLPQLGLGIAFSWSVPMSFAAEMNKVPMSAWFLFITCAIWPVIYDSMYAMADREDDLAIGVKSTAILFDAMDKLIIGLLQCLFLMMLIIVGLMFHLKTTYFLALIVVAILFVYQQYIIQYRNPAQCLYAFYHNNLVGLAIFIGILASYLQ